MVYDWEGEDHKLSNYVNAKYVNKPEGMIRGRVDNSKYYYYGKKGERFEKRIRPNIRSYQVDELGALGFSPSGAKELRNIFKNNLEIKDFETLLDVCEDLPVGVGKGSINFSTKQGLIRGLVHLMSEDIFVLDSKEEFSIVPLLEQGLNLFFNFSGNVGLARVEIMRQMNQVIEWRKEKPSLTAPAIVFEEADALFPKTPRAEEKPLVLKGINYLLRGRKLSLAQYYCCPSFANLNPKIGSGSNEMILGQMEGKDLNALNDLKKDEFLLAKVRRLKYNRHKGEREFIYINELGNQFVFKPFECPQRYHEE